MLRLFYFQLSIPASHSKGQLLKHGEYSFSINKKALSFNIKKAQFSLSFFKLFLINYPIRKLTGSVNHTLTFFPRCSPAVHFGMLLTALIASLSNVL